MAKPIQISIPKPCHEGWENMTPTEKGRFCASCQKNVHDFTNSSDREIAKVFKDNKNICGLFLNSQLNRELVVPKEKKSFWIAACMAITSLLFLGNHKMSAQKVESIEQQLKNKNLKKEAEPIIMKTATGKVVADSISGQPISGITIASRFSDKKTQTDTDGNFSIVINNWDSLAIIHKDYNYITSEIIEKNEALTVVLKRKMSLVCTMGATAVGIKIEQQAQELPKRGLHSIWDLFN